MVQIQIYSSSKLPKKEKKRPAIKLVITCVYIFVGAFQQARLCSHIQKSETHYSQCYQLRAASHAVLFCSVLHFHLQNGYGVHSLHGVTLTTTTENRLISRDTETRKSPSDVSPAPRDVHPSNSKLGHALLVAE